LERFSRQIRKEDAQKGPVKVSELTGVRHPHQAFLTLFRVGVGAAFRMTAAFSAALFRAPTVNLQFGALPLVTRMFLLGH